MNRQFIGWIVAAVLAVALGGVLIFQATDDGSSGSRTAALGSTSSAGTTSAQQADFTSLRDQKQTEGSHQLPDIGAGQQPTRLESNPPVRCDPDLEPNVFAEWRNDPDDLAEAGSISDSIVVGTVTAVSQGQGFSVNVKGEPGNPQVTPVQNVTVHVDQAVKGDAQAGGNVTVEQLGDARGCFRVAGDEPYQQGQQYLLLLEDGAGNRSSHVISPEGRYMVTANNTLRSSHDSDFGEDIDGDSLRQVVNQLKTG